MNDLAEDIPCHLKEERQDFVVLSIAITREQMLQIQGSLLLLVKLLDPYERATGADEFFPELMTLF
jgi:hypothetical protein